MTSLRDIVYYGADAEEDDDGWTIISVEVWSRGMGSIKIEMAPNQAEELAALLTEAVQDARRRCEE